MPYPPGFNGPAFDRRYGIGDNSAFLDQQVSRDIANAHRLNRCLSNLLDILDGGFETKFPSSCDPEELRAVVAAARDGMNLAAYPTEAEAAAIERELA